MDSLLELCKCDNAQICLFCKILVAVVIALVAGSIGFFLGKRKKKQ